MDKSKKLVAYFSCTGTTARAASALAAAANAELFEIKPKKPYSPSDLDWTSKKSRSSVEMSDESCRPESAEKAAGMENYDTVFVGFPIWWYVAPRIVETFLESYDFDGKTVVPFFTSGGSGAGRTDSVLHEICPSARWKPSKRLSANVSEAELKGWLDSLNV